MKLLPLTLIILFNTTFTMQEHFFHPEFVFNNSQMLNIHMTLIFTNEEIIYSYAGMELSSKLPKAKTFTIRYDMTSSIVFIYHPNINGKANIVDIYVNEPGDIVTKFLQIKDDFEILGNYISVELVDIYKKLGNNRYVTAIDHSFENSFYLKDDGLIFSDAYKISRVSGKSKLLIPIYTNYGFIGFQAVDEALKENQVNFKFYVSEWDIGSKQKYILRNLVKDFKLEELPVNEQLYHYNGYSLAIDLLQINKIDYQNNILSITYIRGDSQFTIELFIPFVEDNDRQSLQSYVDKISTRRMQESYLNTNADIKMLLRLSSRIDIQARYIELLQVLISPDEKDDEPLLGGKNNRDTSHFEAEREFFETSLKRLNKRYKLLSEPLLNNQYEIELIVEAYKKNFQTSKEKLNGNDMVELYNKILENLENFIYAPTIDKLEKLITLNKVCNLFTAEKNVVKTNINNQFTLLKLEKVENACELKTKELEEEKELYDFIVLTEIKHNNQALSEHIKTYMGELEFELKKKKRLNLKKGIRRAK
jgi:DNA-binding protein Fis